VNIAVTDMALGNFDDAEGHIMASAEIDQRFPKWAFRVYRFHNHGVLFLLRGDIENADREFGRALDLSSEMDLWPMSANSLAGHALCSLRRGDVTRLRQSCTQLQDRIRGRERVLHDRWMIETALAWYELGRDMGAELVFANLLRVRGELRRRDVDSWLRLELEALRMEEAAASRIDVGSRLKLAEIAGCYSAAALKREATA